MSTLESNQDKGSGSESNNGGVSRWHSGGYAYLSDGDEIVCEHHLCAISGGADPYDVFANDETEIHHLTHRRLNTPDHVRVIEKESHQSLNRGGGYWFLDSGIPVHRHGGLVSNLMDDDEREEIRAVAESV